MRRLKLVLRSLMYYRRSNWAVVAGVAVATAVLCGALAVGDSIRFSLRKLAEQRLGRTQSIVASTSFFREGLASDLGGNAAPLITLQAFVVNSGSGRSSAKVSVFGVDERFWRFHGLSPEPAGSQEIRLSPALANDLAAKPGDSVLVRFEQPAWIPREFLQGRRENAAKTMRLTVAKQMSPPQLAEFSLLPQQGEVRAVFVSLSRLQGDLQRNGQVNTILTAESSVELVRKQIAAKAQLADMGLRLRPTVENRGVSLEHQSTLLGEGAVQASLRGAQQRKIEAHAYFTYLANSLEVRGTRTPYSLITGAEGRVLEAMAHGEIARPGPPPMVLTNWLAEDLHARVGDLVKVEYFVWGEDQELRSQTAEFRAAAVVPIQLDREFAPEYPGITDNDSIASWDPPFPVDLKLVRPKDEEYWKRYRTTPKAWIPLETAQQLWGTRHGRVTSIRFAAPGAEVAAALAAELQPLAEGLAVIPVRESNLQASSGSTDFGEYFLYFSFFLILSSLLLTVLFFRLGVEQRTREVGVLRAVGFSKGQLRWQFLTEGAGLALAGVSLGIVLGSGYGALLLFGLRTWWVDAVGTRLLELHLEPATAIGGAAGSFVVAMLAIWWALRRLDPLTPRALLAGPGSRPVRRRPILPVVLVVLAIGVTAGTLAGGIPPAGGFFGTGALLLAGCLLLVSWWLKGWPLKLSPSPGAGPLARLGARNASWRPSRSVLCISLIASATFLIVSLESFRRGTGGEPPGLWSLVAESQAPLLFDPNTESGRENLNLSNAPKANWELFRLRPGDDVSCLNLYLPRNPRVLGARPSYLAAAGLPALDVPVSLDSAIPAAVDQNSLTYVLHKKVGDEIELTDEGGGRPVRLKIAATLTDSVFQGELIIAERNFVRAFPRISGYRVFLLSGAAGEAGEFETALSDYGFDAEPVATRLAAFHRVENTYLSAFQMLGALGVVLGTIGLAAVLLRNALERVRELGLLRAIGYTAAEVEWVILAENLLLLAGGLLTGLLCALVAVAPAVANRGSQIAFLRIPFLLAAVFACGWLASRVASTVAVRRRLLESIRSE